MSAITPIPFLKIRDIFGTEVDINLANVTRTRRLGSNIDVFLSDGDYVRIAANEVKRFLTALELARQGVFMRNPE